jgi:phage baseplate assembly protein W
MNKIDEYRHNKNDNYVYRDYKALLEPVFERNNITDYAKFGDDRHELTVIDDVYDTEAVKNSLRNLFLINKTEVPGKPNFGSPLNLQIFDLMDEFTESTIKNSIKSAVSLYDNRIEIQDLTVTEIPEKNRIVVTLVYSVIIYDQKIVDSIYLPFSSNDKSYIATRQQKTI